MKKPAENIVYAGHDRQKLVMTHVRDRSHSLSNRKTTTLN